MAIADAARGVCGLGVIRVVRSDPRFAECTVGVHAGSGILVLRLVATGERPTQQPTMTEPTIRFDDGAAYERYMGTWSQLAGETFLAWLGPKPGLRWLDVGCGNGAFTDLLFQRCAPAAVHGIDPSAAQLAFARTRGTSGSTSGSAQFHQGDATALPFADASFDCVVMPLVIFFVPDPAKGVAEMARVVAPGGAVTAYSWDMEGGGFPYAVLLAEMRAMGIAVPHPPSPRASRLDVLLELWTRAGLEHVETREIEVRRTFADFDDYWTTILGGPSVGGKLAAMGRGPLASLMQRMRAHLLPDAGGRITCAARANAVRGRRPVRSA